MNTRSAILESLPARRRSALPLWVLCLSLAATALVCWQLRQEIRAKQEARFEQREARNTNAILARIETYVGMLRGGAGLFNAMGEPSREEFAEFARSLQMDISYPGIQGIGYSKRVAADEAEAFVQSMREDGVPNFRIWPENFDAAYRHSIAYLEPRNERNVAALGFDMFSESTRRAAMERARDTGQPSATGAVTLVQEIDQDVQPGFLIYAPIYRNRVVPETLEARRERLLGFVYSPFRAHDLFREAVSEYDLRTTAFAVFDGESIDSAPLLFATREGLPLQAGKVSTRSIDIAGRPMTMAFWPELSARAESGQGVVLGVGGAGVVLSLILATLVWRQDRARLRAELSEANLRLREEELALSARILKNMTEGVVLVDADNRIVYTNGAQDRMFGYESGELLGRSSFELSAYADSENRERELEVRAALEAVGLWQGEWMQRKKGGDTFFVNMRINPVKLGGREYRILVQHDITQSRLVEQAFAESEARFRAVVETTPGVVTIVAESGKLQYMNRAGREQLGIDEDFDITSFTADAFLQEPFLQEWLANHRKVCAGESRSWQFKVRVPDGPEMWMETRAVPLSLEGRTAQLGVTIDITERKRLEEETAALLEAERAARVESERVGRMKDEFLATLSHELRTPLTAIIGWADLLRAAKPSDEDLALGLETIQRNAQAQVQLTGDLLDMNRIISGKVHLEVESVDPVEVVDAALETVGPLANAKEIVLERRLDALPRRFYSDASRLRQVLWNLLTNAVKFTPPGGRVVLSARAEGRQLCFEVQDTGSGMPPEFLPHVFDRFRQADASTTRAHGGLGLGLSIVKSIVEMHGGTVAAHSEGLGRGSRFSVRLGELKPTAISAEADREGGAAAASALEGRRVLIVEDDKDTRDIIVRMLKQAGGIPFSAASAREGWAVAEREELDLIVSDIGMPEIDGYSFLRHIREGEAGARRDVPAIALTAFARSLDRQRSEEAGYQLHVAKPVDAAQLLHACACVLRGEA